MCAPPPSRILDPPEARPQAFRLCLCNIHVRAHAANGKTGLANWLNVLCYDNIDPILLIGNVVCGEYKLFLCTRKPEKPGDEADILASEVHRVRLRRKGNNCRGGGRNLALVGRRMLGLWFAHRKIFMRNARGKCMQ